MAVIDPRKGGDVAEVARNTSTRGVGGGASRRGLGVVSRVMESEAMVLIHEISLPPPEPLSSRRTNCVTPSDSALTRLGCFHEKVELLKFLRSVASSPTQASQYTGALSTVATFASRTCRGAAWSVFVAEETLDRVMASVDIATEFRATDFRFSGAGASLCTPQLLILSLGTSV